MASRPPDPPRVSVIIPAFQAASYIKDTLTSVQNQTLSDIEIIVVDDGSTDETGAIVAQLASTDPRVRLISQVNAGVAAARNTGIEAASAQFVAPLDADDLWKPEKLELQLAAIQDPTAEYVLAYSWHVAIDEHDRIVGPFDFRPAATGEVLAEFALQNLVGASSPLLRRSVVESIGGYDPSLRSRGGQGSEDWKLFVQMAAAGPVAMVPRFLMGYRRVPGSMSRDHRAALASHVVAVSDIRAQLPQIPPRVLLWSELIHSTFMARTYWREGSRTTSTQMLAWTARRALAADKLFAVRAPFRAYLRMRAARVRDSRDNKAPGPPSESFIEASLVHFETTPRLRLDRAREAFTQTVVG